MDRATEVNPMTPMECPSCHADLDGGEIAERIREHYSPPYRWSRVVHVHDLAGHSHWRCPKCGHEWQ